MHKNQMHLFKTQRFLPLFLTQFFGVLNDNFFKNALIILVLFQIADQVELDGQTAVTIAFGTFSLPFFLLSSTAGQIADKFEKSQLIRAIKFAEILVMGLGAAAFYLGNFPLMLGVLFCMGAQSTFFGPLKYGILPDHLHTTELIGGNALIQTSTFLAILIGTILGGVLVLTQNGIMLVSGLILAFAALGYCASRRIPIADAHSAALVINWNPMSETRNIVRGAFARWSIRYSILGISWFWLVGAIFVSQFPNLVKFGIGGNEHVVTLLLTAFSIGIGIGSLLCNKLVAGEITAKFVPFGAAGVTLFALDFSFATAGLVPISGNLTGLPTFLASPGAWRILFDLTAIAACGGIFIVPLFAIMQVRSDAKERSRTIAANNILNACFVVAGTTFAGLMLSIDMTVPSIFLAVAILSAAVSLIAWRAVAAENARQRGNCR